MDEMPGMIRPDLQALPQVKDRMTFLYLEHCTLGRQAQSPLQTKKGSFRSRRRASRCCCWGRVHG